ncbi:MAG: co-chaperone DjlA [Rhodanobacteraceae bacterium]|jgi:DnaJ like chaperone protein|nr:co-chaperone DjlA [Rhodanobacteraceae bacterium]
MSIIGKVVGAILGLILFHNPVGLLIGALLGHFYDNAVTRLRPPSMGQGFIEPLFAFAGALSKADGRVSETEIAATEALMARLRLDAVQRRTAIERFTRGKQPGFDAGLAIADLKAWCHGRRDLAFIVLDLLLDLVHADGALAQAKLGLVRKLCWALGVSDHELAALSAMKGYAAGPGARPGPGWGAGAGPRPPPPRPSEVDPYAVLGIERGAADRDIKNAYRRLMSQHHPDKLGDVPDELKQRAEERAREINAAYERIKAERGFK